MDLAKLKASLSFRDVAALVTVGSVVLITGVRGTLLDTGLGNLLEFLLGVLVGIVLCGIALLLVLALAAMLARLPRVVVLALMVALLVTWYLDSNSLTAIARSVLDTDGWEFPLELPTGLDILSFWVISLTAGLVAGSAVLIRRGKLANHQIWQAATGLSILGTLYVITVLTSEGHDPFETEFSNFADTSLPVHDLADPSALGPNTVMSLSYGAGENIRRPEFGDERDLPSRAVDASRVLPQWKDFRGAMRERYWGFDLKQAPLNGLVWAPEGDGPFPLVLVVHGNHGMEDYSDGGYEYLGELLASRGYIAVSVDQNYINGTWSGDFGGNEMAARGWLLLEHLRLWRDWNADVSHRFGGVVDMDNIALLGHSRGGEAVSIAYAFNSLSHFPDDATVEFDYGFNIRSLVAIAQVDQRYQRRVELDNVNFLTLQGSYDSDEPAFHGLRQYNRIEFSGDEYFFKAGVYVHGANHGQFNSTWGRTDFSPPQSWLLNLQPIIPAQDQQKIAQVYISAFLDATLGGSRDYLPLFRDPRVGATWLPDVPYVNQFTDSSFSPLANFEEDIDTLSASVASGQISASGYAVWREEELLHRDERLQGSSAVVFGWQETDQTEEQLAPGYSIGIPPAFWSDGYGSGALFSMAVSASTESPPEPDDEEQVDSEEQDSEDADDSNDADDGATAAPSFLVEASLSDGTGYSVQSSAYAKLAPPLKVRYLKHEGQNSARYNADWEPVLQTLEIPVSDLTRGGDPSEILAITIRFDASQDGVVIMDDIGVRRQ